MKRTKVWANHFVCVENARLKQLEGKIFLGEREIMCRHNGMYFECWFGYEGNDDLDRSQMTITGELKERVRRFSGYPK